MRFESWRGMPLLFTLAACGLGLLPWNSARADGYRLHYTIPREVPAYDYTTGGEFMAPPVPYGHYAKDHLYDPRYLASCVGCRMHSMLGCGGCGHDGCGHGSAHGNGDGGSGCGEGGCGGHHKHAGRFAPCDSAVAGCGVFGCGGPSGKHHHHAGPAAAVATAQSQPVGTAVVMPSSQSPCGVTGCGVKGHHLHKGLKGHGRLCGLCGGRGCGGCGGDGLLAGCGDPGCGLCHGKGNGCGFCGGKGCSHCGGGLGSGLHSKLSSMLHHQKVDYFVGAGGPVPITPGYVPYIVVTRSPRDFFAFPPMNPNDP